MDAPRRRLMLAAGAASVLPLAACSESPVATFADFDAARRALMALGTQARTTAGWPLAQVLQHAAQSIEYSIDGFPAPKPALFQNTLGKGAWTVFNTRGRMSHSLTEPIPGAPALDAALPLERATTRLLAAIERFERHGGALQPHFAYGALDKRAYARAHLMHLANHWSEVAPV
ncbi:MAG TPA: DUF1569 domain-containing protein [Aquabacterium sp.]|nr:DUF1569 domain-containing protein [Aquabacterium sp.]